MTRTVSDIVVEIMKSGCIMIIDGEKFGTLLGELLKRLEIAETALDRRTPKV